MRAVGIVRQVDRLGRIVVPKELRRRLGIGTLSDIEIYTEQDTVVVEKFMPSCCICGNQESIFTYRSKHVCSDCVTSLRELQTAN